MSALKESVPKVPVVPSFRFDSSILDQELYPGPVGLRGMSILTDLGDFPLLFSMGSCEGLLPWQYARISMLEERWWHNDSMPGTAYLELLNVGALELMSGDEESTNDAVTAVSDLLYFAYRQGIHEEAGTALDLNRLKFIYQQWAATTASSIPLFRGNYSGG